jgi:hypothetical protein
LYFSNQGVNPCSIHTTAKTNRSNDTQTDRLCTHAPFVVNYIRTKYLSEYSDPDIIFQTSMLLRRCCYYATHGRMFLISMGLPNVLSHVDSSPDLAAFFLWFSSPCYVKRRKHCQKKKKHCCCSRTVRCTTPTCRIMLATGFKTARRYEPILLLELPFFNFND